MKYAIYNKRRGEIKRKLREDHIEVLYNIYNQYGIDMWRSDSEFLSNDKHHRQYFIEKMQWPFGFIERCNISREEKIGYKPNEKQMIHYRITPTGLKLLIQLGYELKDDDVVLVIKETLRN